MAAKGLPENRITRAVRRNEVLNREKNVWNTHWQLLAEYMFTRKSNFTTTYHPGEFLNRDLFDNKAQLAVNTAASSLIGALWPNGAKSFRLNPPNNLKVTRINKKYYEEISNRLQRRMNEPQAGLAVALDEYMKEELVFGTSGVSAFKGEKGKSKLQYRSHDVKAMAIDEGPDGFVNAIYITKEWTIRNAIEQYGIENLSAKVQEAARDGRLEDKIKILNAIEPRDSRRKAKKGNQGMPIQSLHIELGPNKLVLETGFEEMPIKVSRFWKTTFEKYGRSPGMAALPDVLEVNALWEAVTIAIEKSLDPPLAILDDGRLGGSTVDTSAGAINVFNITGRAGERQPIFPLVTVGEIKEAASLIEALNESIANHFFLDRLLDLNNEKEMTAFETSVRNKLRAATLGPIFARQITELYNPLVIRSFNILFQDGEMGVIAESDKHRELLEKGEDPLIIPDEVAELILKGQDVFDIEYLTPAARMMQAEEGQGIEQVWAFATERGQVKPELLDNLDEDTSVRKLTEIYGAPSSILRSIEEVAAERQARREALERQQQLEQAKTGSEAAKNASQAGILPQQRQGAAT